MPSYLSSTHTVGPRRPMISAASSAGDASMNLSGWKSVSAASAEAVLAGERRGPPDVTGQHPGPLDRVERPVEGLRDRGLEQPLAEPDPELAAEDLDDAGRGPRRRPGDERLEDLRLGGRARGGLDGLERRLDLGERGLVGRVGRVAGLRRAPRPRPSRRPTSGRRRGASPRGRRPPPGAPSRRAPTSPRRSSAGPPRGTAGRSGTRPRSAARRASGPPGIPRGSPSSRTSSWSPRRARRSRSSGA